MNRLRLLWLMTPLLLSSCAGLPQEDSTRADALQSLREELRKAEDGKLQLEQQLSELQRRSEEEKKRLNSQLAERQRQLSEEQRKVEALEARIAALEKMLASLRRIDRETLQRAIRR